MADEDVVVVSVGMMTAVGLSAPETAASVRSRTTRFSAVDSYDRHFRPFVMAQVPEDGLPDLEDSLASPGALTARERRMLQLGTMPLLECVQPLNSRRRMLGLALTMPELETTRPLDRKAFLKSFASQTELAFDVQLSCSSHKGRAGGLSAIQHAIGMIRSEQTDMMLVGGIDTLLDLYLLGMLDLEERISSEGHPDGFVPGEGAAFILLASRKAAQGAGVRCLAALPGAAEGLEEGHLYSKETYRGDGLAGALQELFGQIDLKEPVQEVYSSMNGESHWAKEWGVAFVRNKDRFAPDHRMHHPADCFGDTGAACGPLMVGLAALGISQRYLRSPCLVYCSSDRGQRAALVVTVP